MFSRLYILCPVLSGGNREFHHNLCASIQPSLHLLDFILKSLFLLFENTVQTLSSQCNDHDIQCTWCHPRTCGWCIILAPLINSQTLQLTMFLVKVSYIVPTLFVIETGRRIKKMNNSDFQAFQVSHLKWLLHIAITTADWGRLYKLLCVHSDASASFSVMISPCKR